MIVETEHHGPDILHLVRSDAGMCAFILALGLFLTGTGDGLLQHWRSASARQQSLGFEDQLGIVANTAGLIITAWWVLSLVVAVAAALLERRGCSRAASAAGAFTPAFMRRLALAAVGFQLLTAQLASADALPLPDAPAGRPALSASWGPTAAFPAAGPGPSATAQAQTPPPAGAAAGASAGVDPRWQVPSPVVEPGPLAGVSLRGREPAAEGTAVTVRAGDSLWSLTAARLGAAATDVEIAREWPRLYQANREVIGPSPHLLRPGQVLKLPPGN